MAMTPNAMTPRKGREKEKTFKRDPEDYTDDLGKLVRFHDSSPIKKAKAAGKPLQDYQVNFRCNRFSSFCLFRWNDGFGRNL